MNKKVKVGLLITICLMVLLGSIGIFIFADSTDPDKYDRENYIGGADLSIANSMLMGLTHADMSEFLIEGDVAYMTGYISADTIRQVKKLISEYPTVKTIAMTDVGGSIDDVSNLKASRLVREAGLNTFVGKDGHIASGGTDFFCAGIKRTIEEGAQIGVHSWAGGDVSNAALLPDDHEEHKKYIDYYKEMEMPLAKEFYFYTINAAEANSIYYMTMDEIKIYGLMN